MGATLVKLIASGIGKPEAAVDFRYPAMLVRGPSDTGKSYVRDCLWYLLGGDKVPKDIPEAAGYQTVSLEIKAGDIHYEIARGLAGGDARVNILTKTDAGLEHQPLEIEPGDLLVKLSGAEDKQLLRSKSKRGGVTGGDLRHWFLLSQPSMISEEATSGVGTNATQRSAAFNLFITGTDDSGIVLTKGNKELDQLAGRILGAEYNLKRVRADIPEGQTRDEVAGALERVDLALNAMTEHYEARANTLKDLRDNILTTSTKLQATQLERDHSIAMIERFELLDHKYISDSERLGATWEGMAMFQVLDEAPCPLCRTPFNGQPDPSTTSTVSQKAYGRALKAELEKISSLRRGLGTALLREHLRASSLSAEAAALRTTLDSLEDSEQHQLRTIRYEFSGDPRTLALRRSELSEQLARFDDEARLIAEIENLNKAKKKDKVPLDRNVGDAGLKVAQIAQSYLQEWGFDNAGPVTLDPKACDLILGGRARLVFGAGKRSVFLTAMTIAVMEHALAEEHPHPGFVVIDSPLKAYADPKNIEKDVPAATVTSRFYGWLSQWRGQGQIVILENEEISQPAKGLLDPLEFIGEGDGVGRKGFYPLLVTTAE